MRKELRSYIIKRLFWSVLFAVLLTAVSLVLLKGYVVRGAESVKDKNNIIQSFESKDKVLEGLEADYQIIEGEYDEFFKLFPEKNQIVNYVQEIETIAEMSGNIQTIAISDTIVEEKDFNVLPVVINLEGTPEQLHEYLKLMEDLAYFTIVDVIEYKKDEDGEKINTIIKSKLIVE